MKQIYEAVQALESDIGFWRLSKDFVEEAEKRPINYGGNSLGPICKLQIFRNNQSRGFKQNAAAADEFGENNKSPPPA